MTQASAEYARPELLAEADWLEAHLDDPNVRVIDCATFDLYQKAHIKNAMGLRVNPFIKNADDTIHVMPPDQFTKLMGGRCAGFADVVGAELLRPHQRQGAERRLGEVVP